MGFEAQQAANRLPPGLRLLVSTRSARAGTREPLAVTAHLRNDGEHELRLVCDAVVFLLLDGDDAPVTDPGWRHGTTLERALKAGAGLVFTDELALVGPRGGLRQVRLRPGRYTLQGRVNVGVTQSDGSVVTDTLVSPVVPLELLTA